MKLGRGKHTRKDTAERIEKSSRIEALLEDQRLNLSVIQRVGSSRMYGEGLIEYARLLGEWEAVFVDRNGKYGSVEAYTEARKEF